MIVLDASAGVELVLQTRRAERIAARALHPAERLHAPHLIDIEVAQVMRGSATSFALFRVGGSIRFSLHPRLAAKPKCSLTGRGPGRDARFMLPPPALLG